MMITFSEFSHRCRTCLKETNPEWHCDNLICSHCGSNNLIKKLIASPELVEDLIKAKDNDEEKE